MKKTDIPTKSDILTHTRNVIDTNLSMFSEVKFGYEQSRINFVHKTAMQLAESIHKMLITTSVNDCVHLNGMIGSALIENNEEKKFSGGDEMRVMFKFCPKCGDLNK